MSINQDQTKKIWQHLKVRSLVNGGDDPLGPLEKQGYQTSVVRIFRQAPIKSFSSKATISQTR